MNETNPQELSKAIEEYRKRYGKGEIDMFKLDEVIRELRGSNNGK